MLADGLIKYSNFAPLMFINVNSTLQTGPADGGIKVKLCLP